MDPTQDHTFARYRPGGTWAPQAASAASTATEAPTSTGVPS